MVESGKSDIYTKYAGNYVYQKTGTGNDELQFFNTPEGYVEPSGASFDYVYQYKDHLGNIRLSFEDKDGDGSVSATDIIEEHNYYPFGLKHKGYNDGVNGVHDIYMFSGKEFDESFDGTLNTYDFGAINYDPALGRWMNLDPLAELMRRHSPYNYAFNTPILYTDPDGMAPRSVKNIVDDLWEEAGDDGTATYTNPETENSSSGDCGGKGQPPCPEKEKSFWDFLGDIDPYLGPIENMFSTAKETTVELKSALVVSKIPIYDSAGKIVAYLKVYGKTTFNALQIVNGALQGVSWFLVGLDFSVSTLRYLNGDITGARYSFKVSTSALISLVTYGAGGSAGVVVGGVFILGEMVYDSYNDTTNPDGDLNTIHSIGEGIRNSYILEDFDFWSEGLGGN